MPHSDVWFTHELIVWLQNNEDTYLTFSSTGWSSDEVLNWFENHPQHLPPGIRSHDLDRVDWEDVADFIEGDL